MVSPGDSLYGVAVYYGVDPRDLIVRRRDFLPFVVGLFSSSRRLFERVCFSLQILNSKETNVDDEMRAKLTSNENVSFSIANNNDRQRTRRRSAGTSTCYPDNDW